mgnify:CR=1 FL=1
MSAEKLILTPAAVNKYIKSILENDKYLKKNEQIQTTK